MSRSEFFRFKVVGITLLLFALSGCAKNSEVAQISKSVCSYNCKTESNSSIISADAVPLYNKSIRSALDGNLPEAGNLINKALSIEPEDSSLHLWNAIIYHLKWLKGDPSKYKLAESGYLMALKFDPNNLKAALRLSLLYFHNKRYLPAVKALALAAQLDRENPEIYAAMAVSAYYARDLMIASWAARKAIEYRPDDEQFKQLESLISSALGMPVPRDGRSLDSEFIDNRSITRWNKFYRDNNLLLRVNEPMAPESDNEPLSDSETIAAQGSSGTPGFSSGLSLSPGVQSPEGLGANSGPVRKDWSDCQQYSYPKPPKPPPVAQSSSSVNDSLPEREALPSPCIGSALPQMAMLDVTLLRTIDTINESYGINLLKALQIVLSGDISYSKTNGGFQAGRVTETNYVLSLPSGGITYALNIANQGASKSELLLRPSLIALDRQPSKSFTGFSVFVEVGGNAYSSGSLVERKLGMSLSITPTFIDEDSMLLNISVVRAFTAPNLQIGTATAAFTTSSNEASASVLIKFDQTLILSGFRASDFEKTDDGTPLLNRIPLINSLFAQKTTANIQEQDIIVITPRRKVDLDGNLSSESLDNSDLSTIGSPEFGKLRDVAKKEIARQYSNSETVLNQLKQSPMFSEFRNGDINYEYVDKFYIFSIENILQ